MLLGLTGLLNPIPLENHQRFTIFVVIHLLTLSGLQWTLSLDFFLFVSRTELRFCKG